MQTRKIELHGHIRTLTLEENCRSTCNPGLVLRVVGKRWMNEIQTK